MAYEENNDALIAAVRKYPGLYDSRHADNKNLIRKNMLWVKVAEECGFEDDTVARRKWYYLKNYFIKLLKEEETKEASAKTCNGQDEFLKRTWVYKEPMSFLKDYISFSKIDSNSETSDGSSEENTEEKRRKKRKNDAFAKETDRLLCEYLTRKIEEKKTKDNDDLLRHFLKNIECSIRNLSEARQQEAKERIQQIIFYLERQEIEDRTRQHMNVMRSRMFNTQQGVFNGPSLPLNLTSAFQNVVGSWKNS